MRRQVFLGGACGLTTWRRDIAIPLLEAAGVTYHNPQLALGAWTEAHEAEEMRAKNDCAVMLWVVSDETRSVASVAEAAYYIAAGLPLALAMNFLREDCRISGVAIGAEERDDLNRGRIFVRTMAELHGVPIFSSIEGAVQHAIKLASVPTLHLEDVERILADVGFADCRFIVSAVPHGFQLRLQCSTTDLSDGRTAAMLGREWFIHASASPSDVVRTAFKAVVTWQEHEARERFTYKGRAVFGPHFNVEDLAALSREPR